MACVDPPSGSSTIGGGTHARVDLRSEEVKVAIDRIAGVEWVEAETLPPGPRPSVDRSDDDRAACRFLVEIDGCRKHVSDQRGTNSKTGVPPVDR